jgi:hypothetical protein
MYCIYVLEKIVQILLLIGINKILEVPARTFSLYRISTYFYEKNTTSYFLFFIEKIYNVAR